VLAVLFAIPLSAKENVKIKLPDGLYMYDSWVSHTKGESVRFEKFFVVQNNTIYSSQEAIKQFGISKLNELFTEKKKYKILFGGGKIGEIQNLRVDDEDGHKVYREELLTKNIKEGPVYGRKSIYLSRLGSAVKCLGVPEKYKEVKKTVYTTIPQEEVDKIATLAKEKLSLLVKNSVCKILHEENLELLDKISDYNGELYIGLYRLTLKRARGNNWSYCDNQIIFSTKNQNVHFITSREDADWMTICGMLDVDGDGEAELIIERTFGGEAGVKTTMEIHKQKADGNWILVYKIK
jgi:hypothetical protein